eukprot:7996306-Karenia_brevis.AAC.1
MGSIDYLGRHDACSICGAFLGFPGALFREHAGFDVLSEHVLERSPTGTRMNRLNVNVNGFNVAST